MHNIDGKLGIVLSGGGGRGIFEAGVLNRLESDPRFANPDVIAGTSAGAINAALFANGHTPTTLRDFWLHLHEHLPAETNDAFFAELVEELVKVLAHQPLRTLRALVHGAARHRGRAALLSNLIEVLLTSRFDLVQRLLSSIRQSSLAKVTRLRAHLIDCLGGERISAPRCALAINAVDARTNTAVRFVNRRTAQTKSRDYVHVEHITVDMVLASVSIPVLFPSIPLDERILWDGGVLSNTPMSPAVALGADRIVTVLVASNHIHEARRFECLGDALSRLADMSLENAFNVDQQLLLSRNRVAELEAQLHGGGSKYKHVALYEAIRPVQDPAFNMGSFLDFAPDSQWHFYRHGQSAASAWLRRGPLLESHAPELARPPSASTGGYGIAPAAPPSAE